MELSEGKIALFFNPCYFDTNSSDILKMIFDPL